MAERIRYDLYRLDRRRLFLVHLHVHKLLIQQAISEWWTIPRPIGLPLTATGLTFGFLLFLPQEPFTIIRAPAQGWIGAMVLDALLDWLLGH